DVLELALDHLRGDVFAAGRDDQVFFAIGDAKEVAGLLADITGVEPAVLVEGLGRGFGVLVVALEHVAAAHADLAVLGDLDLGAGQRPADPTDLELVGRRHGRGAGALAHAVDLVDQHAEAGEEVEGLLG